MPFVEMWISDEDMQELEEIQKLGVSVFGERWPLRWTAAFVMEHGMEAARAKLKRLGACVKE